MVGFQELHARLSSLGKRLASKRAEMESKSLWHDGHHLTLGELQMRHRYLTETLEAQVSSLEAHRQRISDFERDVLAWINSIDLVIS